MSDDSNEVKCPHCKKAFKIDQSGYTNILQQIRDVEFEKALNERVSFVQEKHQTDIELAKSLVAKEKATESANKDKEIERLKAELNSTETAKLLAIEKAVSPLKEKLNDLDHKVKASETEKDLAIMEATEQLKEELSELGQKIKSKDDMIKMKDEEIDYVKDMKLKMSVKEIGEKLEQWCENQFNMLRASAFPNAYFEKDNKSVKEEGESKGSKGDYIFRESDANGTEFVSIMFEMKDKMDATKGETNNSHLEKLDKDRKKKNCEYAVLVSMLEMDNELYNTGIVDKSHKYEKMYVVRPQNFIPILTLIRNESKKSLQIRNELAIIKSQNLDVETFKNDLLDFQNAFGKNYESAQKNFDKAIEHIDGTIKKLEAVKKSLTTSGRQYRLANDKAQDLTIKKLTRKNPTMKSKFDKIKNDDDDDDAPGAIPLPPQ